MIKRVFSTIKKSSIIVTNNAWNKIEEISKTQKGIFLFSATSGGCNGFNYKLNILNRDEYNKILNTDCYKIKPTIIIQNDTKILVDPKSLIYIDGTELDFTREGLNEGFQFNNPNVKDSCGCGESFTV